MSKVEVRSGQVGRSCRLVKGDVIVKGACVLPGFQADAGSPCYHTPSILHVILHSPPAHQIFQIAIHDHAMAKVTAANTTATKQIWRHANPRDCLQRRFGRRTTLDLRGRGGGPGASLSLYRDSRLKMYGSGPGLEPRSGGVTMRVNTGGPDETLAMSPLSRSRSILVLLEKKVG